jgi:hypothetical protein
MQGILPVGKVGHFEILVGHHLFLDPTQQAETIRVNSEKEKDETEKKKKRKKRKNIPIR